MCVLSLTTKPAVAGLQVAADGEHAAQAEDVASQAVVNTRGGRMTRWREGRNRRSTGSRPRPG